MAWLWYILGQIAAHCLEAVINFAATFAGVFYAFRIEKRHASEEEKDPFGKVLQSSLIVSALNNAHLEVVKACSVSGIPGFSLSNQLGLALGTPLFHRWASHSLVLAASAVSSQMEFLNNLLARLRTAQQGHISEKPIDELKDRALVGQKLIRVMQDLINAELPHFGGLPKADAKLKETRQKLRKIMNPPAEPTP